MFLDYHRDEHRGRLATMFHAVKDYMYEHRKGLRGAALGAAVLLGATTFYYRKDITDAIGNRIMRIYLSPLEHLVK